MAHPDLLAIGLAGEQAAAGHVHRGAAVLAGLDHDLAQQVLGAGAESGRGVRVDDAAQQRLGRRRIQRVVGNLSQLMGEDLEDALRLAGKFFRRVFQFIVIKHIYNIINTL